MGNGLQIQGLCRFSLPCTGGFKKYLGSLAERRAALYAPARLDSRCLWFEEVGLPGLSLQTDPDFTLHVVLGEDFPEPWRSRMEGVFAEVPQIRVHWRAPDDHRAICRDVLLPARNPASAAVAEFRLDDDDAIAIDYVTQLRRAWPKVARLAGPNGRVALDHGRGMVLQAQPDGGIVVHPLLTYCWSAGLAVFLKPDDAGTVMDFPHHKVWQRMPYVNLSDSMMFIRGDHATNDARTPFAAAARLPVPETEFPDILMRRFGIDLDGFRAAWAALGQGA
ncbi:glycosyltransferase [Roseicyclus persicicus]|uniref:Rhamnosyl transferase n=1 Tax=Roseicyclus persicicus TaxID=2650661 RepID=A0A7X6GZW9_9RHOB|nr:glycosyltransferase [Roseibacterium persicicum]NKX45423.1 hypothetical protein [Roseibacterium persicicum]